MEVKHQYVRIEIWRVFLLKSMLVFNPWDWVMDTRGTNIGKSKEAEVSAANQDKKF